MEQAEQKAPAVRLGAELRTARERLGFALPELARSLRIRQAYLEAIETGQMGALPGPTYALGFLRTYATALGLPGEEIARRFRAEAQVDRHQALSFPVPVPQRGVPAGALMLLGLIVLGGAYGGWYWLTEHRATPAETVPPIPDRLAEALPKPAPSPPVASILPSTAAPSPALAPEARSPGENKTAVDGKATPEAKAPEAKPEATPTGTTAPPAAAAPAPPAAVPPAGTPAPATPQPAPAPAPANRIVIKATADAWVTVKPKGGAPVFNKLMHAGDSWPVPDGTPDLLLTTGNAGGTEIDVDGAPMPGTLGTSGMVRHDVPLEADDLKAGRLPPPPARHPR